MSGAPGSRAGSMFGPYHLKRPLGHGGMGEVYEAEHTVKGWTVAVKLMSEDVSSDPVFRERMKREARITGRLQEPHVVPIHDYGEIDGQLFLEMRLIEGSDLDTLLKRFGPLTPPRAVAMITQMAKALDAAHAAGVLHRDVKPPNILVTRDDFAYLVDFGIASAKSDEKLTQRGNTVGTWKYMAPERFSGDEVTHESDIYSLACVLYECLTGTPPYASDNSGVLVSAHMMDPIPRPSLERSGIPKAFDAVIARGMAKTPSDRYAAAGDLAQAAMSALTDPDQNRADKILRRSEEATLPGTQQLPKRPPPPAAPTVHPPGPNPPAPQPFVDPTPWNQPQPKAPRNRNPWPIVVGASAVVIVIVLAGVGISLATRDDDTRTASHRATTTTAPSTTTITITTSPSTPGQASSAAPTEAPTQAPPEVENRLLGLLPSGYPGGTCKQRGTPMPGAIVSVMCGQNTDVDGPSVSAYGLFSDIKTLQDTFTGFTKSDALVSCPGGKSSPGTWWHTKDPNTVLGQLACGVYKNNEPQVMWTNQQTMVFAVVGGKQQAPNLDQLYKWWTSHS